MTYSVLVKVNNTAYKNQKFFLYKSGVDKLTVFTLEEANALAEVLKSYPPVFSEVEVVPREQSEIKLLDIADIKNNFDFNFEMVLEDCKGLLEQLNDFDFHISGIDYKETKRQIFSNE
jgi:hypothetical protein